MNTVSTRAGIFFLFLCPLPGFAQSLDCSSSIEIVAPEGRQLGSISVTARDTSAAIQLSSRSSAENTWSVTSEVPELLYRAIEISVTTDYGSASIAMLVVWPCRPGRVYLALPKTRGTIDEVASLWNSKRWQQPINGPLRGLSTVAADALHTATVYRRAVPAEQYQRSMIAAFVALRYLDALYGKGSRPIIPSGSARILADEFTRALQLNPSTRLPPAVLETPDLGSMERALVKFYLSYWGGINGMSDPAMRAEASKRFHESIQSEPAKTEILSGIRLTETEILKSALAHSGTALRLRAINQQSVIANTRELITSASQATASSQTAQRALSSDLRYLEAVLAARQPELD